MSIRAGRLDHYVYTNLILLTNTIRVLNYTHWSVCEGPQVFITETELGVVELGTQVLTALFSLPHGLLVQYL